MDVPRLVGDRCDGCGLLIDGGTDGCQQVMDTAVARDFSDVLYFANHRLLVDTYCLQHPERYCVSFKSFAAHLMGLCWSLEHRGSRAVPGEPIRRWVERHPMLDKPAVPAYRGALTIADVAGASDPAQYAQAVHAWASATWAAYAGLHADARRWMALALGRE